MEYENLKIKGFEFKILMDEAQIQAQVERLADEINDYYEGRSVSIVVVLKGAYVFAADLCRLLKVNHEIHFVKFTSYDGFSAKPTIKCDVPLEIDVEGKNILIIEDIIDSGNTMAYFLDSLKVDKPNSLDICSFLLKPKAIQQKLPLKFVGCEIDNGFVIGYGMDFNEEFRSLKHIYQKI